MTDEREPTIDTPAADDVTSRVPTSDPATGPAQAVPPTAPLTPASPAASAPMSYDHEVAWSSGPAAASPVVPPAKAPRKGGRARWALSLAVVALVIVASAAVAAIITGRSSTAVVLGYVPAGTTAYAEVRLDLPGDQRAAAGEFLSKFPGFADQAALDSKLDEVLDQLVKDATNNEQTYTANIKPWFDGELAFSVGPLPPAPTASGDGSQFLGSSRALALVSIKDQALAQAWFDAAIAKTGAKTTSQAYNGATLTVFEPTDGATFALAMIDGKVAAAGDIASVKEAIDSKGSSGFASEPGPKAALDSVKDDYVGFGYVALRPFLDWSNDLNKAQGSALGGAAVEGISDSLINKVIPEWTAYWLRFEKDALVMEATAPRAETATGPTDNRTSTIVEHVPASAIFAATSHDVGKSLKEMLDLYSTDATAKPVIDQLNQALDLVGGPDAAFGWARDVAIAVDATNGTPEGGLIVEVNDAAAAQKLFTALRTFIKLGGDQVGATVKDETYNGTTITTISLGDLGKLSGMAGGSAAALPVPSGNLEISYAVTDKVAVIGSGAGFVKAVLDTTPSTSLASNETYKTLSDRAGTGTGGSYANLGAIREFAEKWVAAGDPAELKKYETDIKPFLVPFDAMFAAGSIDGDLTRSVIYITVK